MNEKRVVTAAEINTFISRQPTWFLYEDMDYDDDDDNDDDEVAAAGNPAALLYTTRDNGDVGEETPGRADIVEAKRLMTALDEAFGPSIDMTLEAVDEWVHLTVYVNPSQPVPVPWGGWKLPRPV